MAENKGKIIQVVGVVVDVEFPEGTTLPAIYDALTTMRGKTVLMLEVAQHLSKTSVRTIAMSGTDGLKRGDEVANTGAPIQVPVGADTQGRMFNVTGDPIDNKQLLRVRRRRFTVRRLPSPSRQTRPRFWRQVSRSLT